MNDDVHYRLLKLLAERPEVSQRDLARALGVSLGKINYCVKALLDQGWVKASNFRNSNNKLAYAYLLTPSGIDAKARITADFLKRKLAEYQTLKAEIARLQAETTTPEQPAGCGEEPTAAFASVGGPLRGATECDPTRD